MKNRIADILDISKMTDEQKKQQEEDFLAKSYICDKCRNLHMSSENLDGNVCFPPMGDHHCDGILRKARSLDDVFGPATKEENRNE